MKITQNQNEKFDMTVDLCVIGSAASGLSCAMHASQLGVEKILVIDKGAVFGGASRIAAGMLSVESPVQRRMGIHEKIDDVFREEMNLTNWDCDARLVRKWLTTTGVTVDWLEKLGVHFENVVPFLGQTGKCRRLFHMANFQKTGNEIVKALLNGLNKNGVTMMTRTRAKTILQNEDGSVCGLIAETADGSQLRISAKAVTICTGSFAANRDLVEEFYPGRDWSRTKIMSALPNNTGDGYLMAREAGAGKGDASIAMIGPHNHPNNMRVGLIMKRPYLMYLNRNGERFVDESITAWHDWGWMTAVSLDRQPGRICFPLMDEGMLESFLANKRNLNNVEDIECRTKSMDILSSYGTEKPVETKDDEEATSWLNSIRDDIASEVVAGRALKADTLDEVAEWIGADPETVKKTVADYNESCRIGYDNELLKDPEYLVPFTKGPWYVFKGFQGVDTCIGGVPVDHRQRVLTEERTPIPGLYAAGVCTSGWMGHTYGYFGACMSYTVYSGYSAGAEIAAQIKAN